MSPFPREPDVPWREGRLSVRPGIMGSQVADDRGEGDFHQWIYYDRATQHMSVLVDLKIIVATILTSRWCAPLTWIIWRQPSRCRGDGARRRPTAPRRQSSPDRELRVALTA
jgi:hypothetical protein